MKSCQLFTIYRSIVSSNLYWPSVIVTTAYYYSFIITQKVDTPQQGKSSTGIQHWSQHQFTKASWVLWDVSVMQPKYKSWSCALRGMVLAQENLSSIYLLLSLWLITFFIPDMFAQVQWYSCSEVSIWSAVLYRKLVLVARWLRVPPM